MIRNISAHVASYAEENELKKFTELFAENSARYRKSGALSGKEDACALARAILCLTAEQFKLDQESEAIADNLQYF